MGISSDGQLTFGIPVPEEFEFPWSDEKYDNDWEDWWTYGVCGYVPPFEIFNSAGEYLSGIKPNPEKQDEYFDRLRKFQKENPMPVNIEMFCSYDYPMYIVCPANKIYSFSCSRGEAIKINPSKLKVPETEIKKIIDFCEKYLKPSDPDNFPEMNPAWYLTSLYG